MLCLLILKICNVLRSHISTFRRKRRALLPSAPDPMSHSARHSQYPCLPAFFSAASTATCNPCPSRLELSLARTPETLEQEGVAVPLKLRESEVQFATPVTSSQRRDETRRAASKAPSDPAVILTPSSETFNYLNR